MNQNNEIGEASYHHYVIYEFLADNTDVVQQNFWICRQLFLKIPSALRNIFNFLDIQRNFINAIIVVSIVAVVASFEMSEHK